MCYYRIEHIETRTKKRFSLELSRNLYVSDLPPVSPQKPLLLSFQSENLQTGVSTSHALMVSVNNPPHIGCSTATPSPGDIV